MQLPPCRPLGDSHLTGLVGVESAKADLFDQSVSERELVLVIHGIRQNRISLALDRSIRHDLDYLEGKGLLVAPERDRLPEKRFRTGGTPKPHRLRSAL